MTDSDRNQQANPRHAHLDSDRRSRNLSWLLFSFSGRIGRKVWWLCFGLYLLASVVVLALTIALMVYMPGLATLLIERGYNDRMILWADSRSRLFILFFVPLCLFTFLRTIVVLPWLAVTAKRLHDAGRNAWIGCGTWATNVILMMCLFWWVIFNHSAQWMLFRDDIRSPIADPWSFRTIVAEELEDLLEHVLPNYGINNESEFQSLGFTILFILALIFAVRVLNFLLVFYFAASRRGESGPNRFGSPPGPNRSAEKC